MNWEDPITPYEWWPMENVPPTEITVAGKALDANGNVYFVWEDNTTHDVTPRANARYYTFTVGASKQCAPVKIRFSDNPEISSDGWPCSFRFTLRVVCHNDWNPLNMPTVLKEVNWGYDIDASGHATVIPPTGNGSMGDCGEIVITEYSGRDHFTDPDHPGVDVSGAELEAYYIGCCGNDLNWVQIVTTDSLHTNHVPRFDGPPGWPYPPYYYGPPDSSWAPLDQSDYSNSQYPQHCP